MTANASQHPLDQQLAALLQTGLSGIAPEKLPLLSSFIQRLSSKTREGVIAKTTPGMAGSRLASVMWLISRG